MIIDFHTHVHPPEDAAEPLWQGRSPMTIENVLKAQEIGGVDISFISNPLHHLNRMDRDQQYQAVDRSNSYLVSHQEKHASIFAFACAVPWGGDRFLRQFERAIKQSGMLGAWIQACGGARRNGGVARTRATCIAHPRCVGNAGWMIIRRRA